MSQPIANVNPNYDTWATMIERVNQMADTFTFRAVTTFANTTGASTTGNGHVIGIFGSTTLFAGTDLRGGSVAASANLTISSNAIFNSLGRFTNTAVFVGNSTFLVSNTTNISGNNLIIGALTTASNTFNFNGPVVSANTFGHTGPTFTISGNVSITNANTTITSTLLTVDSIASFVKPITAANTLVVNGAVTANAALNVNGVATFAANTIPSANAVSLGRTDRRWNVFAETLDATTINANVLKANTFAYGTIADSTHVVIADLGANTSTAQTIYTFPRSTYNSATFHIQLRSGVNTQHSQSSVVHNNTEVFLSTYGVLYSNTQIGFVDAVINGANVDIKVLQAMPNLSVRAVATLIK